MVGAGLIVAQTMMIGASTLDCKGPVTAGGVADAAGTLAPIGNSICTWLEGETDVQAIVSICAVVEEIGLIASIVAPLLASTPADAGPCTTLPGTTICATRRQIGIGIQAVLEKRRRALLLDAAAAGVAR